MAERAYPIPAEAVQWEEEIKKSRFITLLRHTQGLVAARAFVSEIRALHPQARHHCWAMLAGAPDYGQGYGFSDDGEPSGTAGKPMLAQLQGSGVGEVTAVVVRYYGGIKLGTGGLVRAYGGGVSQALKLLPRRQRIPMVSARLQCRYDELPVVQRLLAQFGAHIEQADYAAQVGLQLACESQSLARLEQELRQHTQGRVRLECPDKPDHNIDPAGGRFRP